MTDVRETVTQAWIDLGPEDPQAFSALTVMRERLSAGRRLRSLGRQRLIEVRGSALEREYLAERWHASTQFYNPHKETCVFRDRIEDAAPVPSDAWLALVWDRGGARRAAAERWWRHETGEEIEVHEGVVWTLRFANGADGMRAGELARLLDRRHGLLAHPVSQELRLAFGRPPLPWIERDASVEVSA